MFLNVEGDNRVDITIPVGISELSHPIKRNAVVVLGLDLVQNVGIGLLDNGIALVA
jgi:hypothetical protein